MTVRATDIKRLIKAAQDAGLSVAAIGVDAAGKPFVRTGEPLKATEAADDGIDDIIAQIRAGNARTAKKNVR